MRHDEKLSMDEMRDMAVGFGYDGDGECDVHNMADMFKVSPEFRKELLDLYYNAAEES